MEADALRVSPSFLQEQVDIISYYIIFGLDDLERESGNGCSQCFTIFSARAQHFARLILFYMDDRKRK